MEEVSGIKQVAGCGLSGPTAGREVEGCQVVRGRRIIREIEFTTIVTGFVTISEYMQAYALKKNVTEDICMENLPTILQEQLSNFLNFLPDLIMAIVIFFATIIVSGIAARAIKRTLTFRKTNENVTILLAKLGRWTVFVLGTITALQQVDFDVTAFIAGLGVLGIAAGFALQDVTSNFVAGVILLLNEPFAQGDLVEISGVLGNVEAIDLRSTEIKSLDGQNVFIPNSTVLTSIITNRSKSNLKRIEVAVGVAYDSNLQLVRETSLAAVKNVQGCLDSPEPFVRFHTFGGSSIDLSVFFWVDAKNVHPLDAKDAGINVVKAAFDKAGIEIPFPITTVFMEKE